jgi:hypothetical protein
MVWILLTLVAIAAAVFFAPVTMDVSLVKDAEHAAADVRVRFQWLIFSVRTGGRERPSHSPNPDRRPRRSGYGWASMWAALRSPGFVRRCGRLVAGLAGVARPERVSIRGRVGFEDPADTGLLFGLLFAATALCPAPAGWHIAIDPDFGDEGLEGQAELRWSRTVASVLWPVLRFVISPAVWRAAFSARRSGRTSPSQAASG